MAATQDIFTPASLTVKQLFNNSDSLYQIPRYQRPYKWADEQIDKLWDDLTEAYENQTESYFLGSIITAAPKDTSSYLDVVDGQQRITTLMILFASVRDLFPSLNRNPANPDPSNITSKTIKSSILADDEFNRLKLYTHINHQTDFENLIINADTTKILKPKKKEIESDEEPRFKFLNTAAMFNEKLTAKGEDYIGKFMNYLFNNVRVIRIDCTSKEFAIKLFQVLNDRGLDLTNADLIKSYLIQKIEEEYKTNANLRTIKENQFMQEWVSAEQIIKKFDDSLNDVFILYEYHLLGSNPKRSLYDELVAQFKPKNSLDIIKDFKKFVENYNQYLWEADNTDIFALWYLRWNFYWKSILLTAYHTNYPNIPKLSAALKRFYYIYWIAGKTLTAIKQTSFNLIGYVKERKDITEIEAILQKKMEDDKIIATAIQALNNNMYSEPWGKPLFCLLEYNATDKSKLTWIPLTKELHLEHIIPTKHKNFSEWSHITDEMFDYWGSSGANLTLLGGSKNIEASDNPFKDKINVYKGKGLYQNKNTKVTGFNITQKIVTDFDSKKYNMEWTQEAIFDRWEWFCIEVEEVLKIDTSPLLAARPRSIEKAEKAIQFTNEVYNEELEKSRQIKLITPDENPTFQEIEDYEEMDDDNVVSSVDREYWIKKKSKESIQLADQLLELLGDDTHDYALVFKKTHIKLNRNGDLLPFVRLRPLQKSLTFVLGAPRSPEIDTIISTNNLEDIGYNNIAGRYRVRIRKNDLENKGEALKELFQAIQKSHT